MLSSTHLSSVGGADDQYIVNALGLTATSGHTVDDDVLLLGDKILDHIYPISINLCGGERDVLDTACLEVFRPTPDGQLNHKSQSCDVPGRSITCRSCRSLPEIYYVSISQPAKGEHTLMTTVFIVYSGQSSHESNLCASVRCRKPSLVLSRQHSPSFSVAYLTTPSTSSRLASSPASLI